MAAIKTIHRYIFHELFSPFFLCIGVLTCIFSMLSMLQITDYVVNYNVGLKTVFSLLAYSMPFFFIFMVPMSVMLAVLLTFLRMSQDNEITALKAAGTPLKRLLAPVVAFCLVAAAITAFMSVVALPWGRLGFKGLVADVIRSHVEVGVKPGAFMDTFKDVVLYVDAVEAGGRSLKSVFIEDRSTPGTVNTIVAKKGRLVADKSKTQWYLRLNDGVINSVVHHDQSQHSIWFETYDYRLALKNAVHAKTGPKDEEEMTLAELDAFIHQCPVRDDKYFLALLEYNKKFSLPFSCLVLGLMGVPLGIVSKRAKRSVAISVGLLFFLIYYLQLSAGCVFGEAGVYPPFIGMWVPNVTLFALFLVLFARSQAMGPLSFFKGLKIPFKRGETP